MPLTWKRGENSYCINYFGILQLGPQAQPGVISARRKDITRRIQTGKPHMVGGREVNEAEVTEAESRLLDEQSRAAEVLLVHPLSAGDSKRLQQICSAIAEQATPSSAPRVLRLANLRALAPLIPTPCAEDVALPEWEEFNVAGPDSPEDRQHDVQFDL